jgi:glycerol-3-phosphate dehydrogenase
MTALRDAALRALGGSEPFDVLVIGGGATGLSVALDAATRGLRVALVEGRDFAEGTSSKATKLLHGGVRYLAQGDVRLVRQALHERSVIMRNAPHLAQPIPFLIPVHSWAERAFYEAGLRVYDLLAGRESLGATRWIGAQDVRKCSPHLNPARLSGAVVYMDGQFDDARLAIALARTAQNHGAQLLNHLEVTGLIFSAGRIEGAQVRDRIHGERLEIRARCVVNATGVWVDDVLRMMPGADQDDMHVRPSQGVHLVLRGDWLDGRHALLVPRTSDGRVLFAVPWLGHTILGTTDTAVEARPLEPHAQAQEVAFLQREARLLFDRPVCRDDVLSVWAGLRPLVQARRSEQAHATRSISREHSIWADSRGLVSVTGGKWTTCRAMAEEVVDVCVREGLLPACSPCRTRDLRLQGAPQGGEFSLSPSEALTPLTAPPGLHLYGTDAAALQALPGADDWIAEGLSVAMVRFAARHEWAVRVGDVLARRSRLLFVDAAAARRAAPQVASILQKETGTDADLCGFLRLVQVYQTLPEAL